MYTACKYSNYLLACFPPTSSHLFQPPQLPLAPPHPVFWLLTSTLPYKLICTSSLFLQNLNVSCLFRSFSSPPFQLFFMSLFTVLAFFCFIYLHEHHKCSLQNLSQFADTPHSPLLFMLSLAFYSPF